MFTSMWLRVRRSRPSYGILTFVDIEHSRPIAERTCRRYWDACPIQRTPDHAWASAEEESCRSCPTCRMMDVGTMGRLCRSLINMESVINGGEHTVIHAVIVIFYIKSYPLHRVVSTSSGSLSIHLCPSLNESGSIQPGWNFLRLLSTTYPLHHSWVVMTGAQVQTGEESLELPSATLMSSTKLLFRY